ncbi:hypothetical protein CO033_01205 [Candidatus Nomurabacteria bacterium CG_4_9_14_0_2_um_filter_32_10]|uniref:Uncharacterized protein n=3 Tax=Candidatus Nomuraibacteriota TaxID=1752729 RepID=A0A2H0CH90_9BACT|nr:MAG: hypothetical protein COW91_00910 [Candidatus Nomurabacteria bacterium CG22_combo_CG10-13_8_21_14_all_32_8]PIZ86384.1 MAG: hypothetical protein COX94_00285 [Candidatus Nomurabacteria bacterium CG_4_10_14_0_2_um_filter_33_9]PJC49496.1 MAG: hypothetical protein CO033_01205 [Candidatus Nomurabacteria bacterium CG_4_9_14_0_2_um_filter_32_10]
MDYKSQNVVCQNCKVQFTIESEDFNFYEKIKVPPPTFCPECRAQRRFIWRNERTLYKRKCDLCGKNIIGLYPEKTIFPVFCYECWYSDAWDPLSYGLNYDPSIPFFNQLKNLMQKVPRLAIWVVASTKSEYTNQSYFNKNTYLSFALRDSENAFYVGRTKTIKNSLDATYTHFSELMYDSVNVEKSYNSAHIFDSEAIIDSMYIFSSRNCQNCFGGTNLRSANYIYFGEKLSKDSYKEKINSLDLGSRIIVEELENKFKEYSLRQIHRALELVNCTNSIGNYLINSKDCFYVFDGFELENARNSVWVFSSKDISDCYGMGSSNHVYETIGCEEVANCFFANITDSSTYTYYTDLCKSSQNLFGCVSLKSKKYCILNKQYSKEEYLKLIKKIKEDMNNNPYIDKRGIIYKYGEFFPVDLSPFAYNETIAQEFYPKNKEQIINLGFKFFESETRNYIPTIKIGEIPDNIEEIEDDFCNEIIECKNKGKIETQCTLAFKIILDELSLYRKLKIPIPEYCPNCRHYQRLTKHLSPKIFNRICVKCKKDIKTSYSPERPEIVYCEKCYQQEVY